MRNLFSVFLIIGLFFAKNMQASHFPFQEVEEMVKQDDFLRIRWINEKDLAVRNEIAQEIRFQEISNTQKIKEIVSHSGLPLDSNISDICKLILRSSDLNFQTGVLSQILALDDESWLQWVPNLIDRILLRQGLPQRYGTHLHLQDGSYEPYSIENLEKVDALRKEFCNLPLKEYIQKIRQIFIACHRADETYKQKLFFNQRHNFYGNPDDYLYVILNENDNNISSFEVSSTIAFEHPAYAAIHALQNQWDWNYELREDEEIDDEDEDFKMDKDGGSNFMICYQDLLVDPFLSRCDLFFSIPCSVFLVPKENFRPIEFEDRIFKQIFIAPEGIRPIAKFVCDSFLDPLLTLERKVKIEWERGSCTHTQKIDSSYLYSFLFDITLENEDFGIQ